MVGWGEDGVGPSRERLKRKEGGGAEEEEEEPRRLRKVAA